jgi:hypothetical protein
MKTKDEVIAEAAHWATMTGKDYVVYVEVLRGWQFSMMYPGSLERFSKTLLWIVKPDGSLVNPPGGEPDD